MAGLRTIDNNEPVSEPCPRCGGLGLWKSAGNYIAPVCQNCGVIGQVFFNDIKGPTVDEKIASWLKDVKEKGSVLGVLIIDEWKGA